MLTFLISAVVISVSMRERWHVLHHGALIGLLRR